MDDPSGFSSNGTHWLKCFRTHELNHAITSAGHQCHHLGAELKIMGSLRFKNSLYCSFSRHKLLWSQRKTNNLCSAFSAWWGGSRQSHHDQNLKEKQKQEHYVWRRMRQWFILNRKKRQTADRIPNMKIFQRHDIIYIDSPGLLVWSVVSSRVWRCQSSVLTWSVTPLL